ncbi:unnamed protein product [Cuscuta campestris]|uniref:Nucleobase-ascorbate transporter 11 n=1 Tax=Cuscuta campestris TaxID=132261 RepID=A0A484NE24_9ASTE|nr:unnamed protein product [Cuscuta campestris]
MGDKLDAQKGQKPGSSTAGVPKIEPFVPRKGYDPRELKSWAKKTGFVSHISGETDPASLSGRDLGSSNNARVGLERGFDKLDFASPKIELDPILGRTKRSRGVEILPAGRVNVKEQRNETLGGESEGNRVELVEESRVEDEESKDGLNGMTPIRNSSEVQPTASSLGPKKDDKNVDHEMGIRVFPDWEDHTAYDIPQQSSRMKCGLRDNPGYAPLFYYGLQHFLSLVGSLIFIPLIIVPAMGGTDKDTATVISTTLLVSGLATVLHSYLGTRLPLVQGSSFVYLAPALVIMNSEEYRNLSENKFRHIMRELQGAIIVGSVFQSILGFTGLMSLFVRLINPIVVAPTIAAVGLAFFSYGFPQAGSCIEISSPLILLVLAFTLYLRGISIFGHRVFRIYAVPLSVVITWAFAFFLTAGGAYNYKDCSSDIPSSNILIDACRKHVYTMRHCRTDVGTYHSASMRINLKPPTPGIVSRGIGLEGFCSVLAGLWGTGTGATTLIENVHTIDVTMVANRRALELGSLFLIAFSFLGKACAILASIPQALAAAVLCFIWALVLALGLSTLQYTQTTSSRNVMIVGVSLLLGFSIPAYVQQYQPVSSLILPPYLLPYAAASSGPIRSGSTQIDFALNALMSLNMVVTLLVAFILDNTVPGTRQQGGVYIWSTTEEITSDPSSFSDYSLPSEVARCFRWAKCMGL